MSKSRFALVILFVSSIAQTATAAPALMRAYDVAPTTTKIAAVDEYFLEVAAKSIARAESIDLVLPDGVFVAKRMKLTEREEGFFWHGSIHEAWAVFITEHQGALAGLIYTPWVTYEIYEGPDGALRLAHVDQGEFPGCATAEVPADAPTDAPGNASAAAAAPAAAGDPIIMDVLVVYTPQARSGAGGTSQIVATIQSAVDITNTAYANSDIDARLRLVHTQEVSYNDSGSSSSDLSFVRTDPTVANLRNTHGADLVGLIVNGNDACGRGYVQRSPGPSFESLAFQVTTRSCAVGNLSFAHEFGHNQGCEHDPANGTSPANASYPWSFGHFHSGAYRTVMSYSNQCVGGCSRAPYFSNPAVSHQSRATGIANQRDNHRTINLTASIVANFRPTAGGGFEVGAATRDQTDGNTFYAQGFASTNNPIVVMGPVSFNGSNQSVVRVRNVTSTGFQYQVEEWDYLDGVHITETIGWFATSAGSTTIGNLAAEAGSVTANHGWVTVNLAQSFSAAPVVIPQVATRNGGQAVTVRLRNITANSFQLRLQEEEGNDGTHVNETVSFVAVQPGTTSVGGRTIVVGRTGNVVTHNFLTINFANVSNPAFFGALQTYDGSDPSAVRYRNLTSTSVQVKAEEEASGDTETSHTTEVVGYMVVGRP